MRLGKDLENKPIISVSDGQMLGRTKDVYLDKEMTSLAGLYIGTEGVIRRKDKIIPSDRVVVFGIDAILVQDPDVITTDSALPEAENWHRLSHVNGKQVITPGATKLATIDDIVFDEQGVVSGFSLSRVHVTGPLAEKPFIPREVVIDAFQSGDLLIVDFRRLESMFTEPETDQDAGAAEAEKPLQDNGDSSADAPAEADTGKGRED